MGVVGALRQRQADLVLVDGLPEVLAVARRPVVVETAQVVVDFIQVPLLEASGGAGRKQRNVQPTRSSETEGAKHAHLQQQGVDAHDPRLGDGRQEVVFNSEGHVKTSVRSRRLQLRGGHVTNGNDLSPLALRDNDEHDDQRGADAESRHQDLDQEHTCTGPPTRRQ